MSKGLSFRADIQGLRAIAVLAVMLFHANRQVLPGGFVGVDVFFVISGFLITAILLKQKESVDFSFILTLKQFYIGRIKRIAPAYYMLLAVVTIITIISAIILIPKDYQFFHESLHDSLWFASNQYFANFGNYFAPEADELPLLHTWSLAIEMQFYLLYPFFILLIKKAWLKKVIPILVIVLFGICVYQLNERLVQGIYYELYARIPEFLIGGSVILFAENLKRLQSKWLPALGLVLIVASFVGRDSDALKTLLLYTLKFYTDLIEVF